MELLLLVGGWLAMKTKLSLFSSVYCIGLRISEPQKACNYQYEVGV